ncbi:hypothetical protein DPMN_000853 [Dreissena polymorpha]|uniref:Uncharacterized protein n=1 Tax=Dreissena polymorpha TaxID=45954 RepID=A0A9D4MJU0_DREPO|nr:hypothetical protein DPMN_000853 [Dreissena polymorpha]
MKNILEMKQDQPCEHLGVASIEQLMLAVVRSVLNCSFNYRPYPEQLKNILKVLKP